MSQTESFLGPLSAAPLRPQLDPQQTMRQRKAAFPAASFYFIFIFFFLCIFCVLLLASKFMQVLGTLFQEFSLFSQDYDFIKIMCRAGCLDYPDSALENDPRTCTHTASRAVGKNKHTHTFSLWSSKVFL